TLYYPNVENYIRCYDEMSYNVVLQVNRWHFFLENIHNDFGCSLVHIVRHPNSVYQSMVKGRGIKSWIFKYRLFYIYAWHKKLYNYYQRPRYLSNDTLCIKKLNFFRDTYNLFFISWVLSNYEAIKSIQNTKSYLIVYEDLIASPKKYDNLFLNEIGLKTNLSSVLNSSKHTELNYGALQKKAEQLDVGFEYDYIYRYLKSNNTILN
ncbi:MAG: hypothetical protein ACLFOC_07440, partial [Campylobacterales bacterium]